MQKCRTAYTGILVLLFPLFVQAQETIDLDTAVQTALEYNTQVKRSENSLLLEKTKSDTVWNNLYPEITAQGRLSKQYNPETDATVSGTLGASLTLSPALIDTFAATRLSLEKGEISYHDAKRSIERSVRKSWYALVTEKEQLSVLTLSRSNSESSYRQTQEKYNAGLSSEIDLLNARIEAEQAALALKSAETSFENSKAVFSQLIGLDPVSGHTFLLDDFEAPGETIDISDEGINNSSIQALEKQLAYAKAMRGASFKANFLPYVSLGWSHEESALLDSMSNRTDRSTVSATVGMKLDALLPGSSARTSLAEADASITDTELELEDTRQSVQLEIRELLSSISNAQDDLKGYRNTLELAERSLELTREAYQRGTRDFLALQNAEENYRETKLQVVTRKKKIMEGIIDLEYLTGLPYGTFGGTK